MTSPIPTNHNKKRSCLMFYVYSYCCGKCTGIIAIILAFTESSSVHVRALLVVALTLSVLSFFAHAVISRRPQTSTLVLTRSVVVSSGLMAASASAGCAVYYTWGSVSLLFVCCILLSAIYLLACVGYVVNVKLHWKGGPTTDAPMSARGGPFHTSLALVGESAIPRQIYYVPSDAIARQIPCTTDPAVTSRTDVTLRLPAYEDLPTYEQLYSTDPPKYSNGADTATLTEPVDKDENASPDADFPPKYEEVVMMGSGNDVSTNGNTTANQQT